MFVVETSDYNSASYTENLVVTGGNLDVTYPNEMYLTIVTDNINQAGYFSFQLQY